MKESIRKVRQSDSDGFEPPWLSQGGVHRRSLPQLQALHFFHLNHCALGFLSEHWFLKTQTNLRKTATDSDSRVPPTWMFYESYIYSSFFFFKLTACLGQSQPVTWQPCLLIGNTWVAGSLHSKVSDSNVCFWSVLWKSLRDPVFLKLQKSELPWFLSLLIWFDLEGDEEQQRGKKRQSIRLKIKYWHRSGPSRKAFNRGQL